MLTKEEISFLEDVDVNYIIGGSNAMMIYLGKETRKCNDLDLHLMKKVDKDVFCDFPYVLDISYEIVPHTIYNGVRLIQLEYLISIKLKKYKNKKSSKHKDDLFHLLQLSYNETLLNEYNQQNGISLNNFKQIKNEILSSCEL